MDIRKDALVRCVRRQLGIPMKIFTAFSPFIFRDKANNDYDMTVPRTRLLRYGPRSFAVSVPVLWNSLPAAVRDPALTVPQFLRRLKTELFSRAY